MRASLTLAVAQPRCVSADLAHNAGAHAALVRAAGARVVVFPELSLTGYELDAPPVDVTGPAFAEIGAACAESGSVALVGAPVRNDDGTVSIATVVVDGVTARVGYRKLWLGDAESIRFVPGDRPTVWEVDGWRLGLAICKDFNTPEHVAATRSLGIDAYLAGTVKRTDEAAAQRDRAARIAERHRVWVAVASFAGPTGEYTPAAGGSGVWRPGGALVAQAGPEPQVTVPVTLVAE